MSKARGLFRERKNLAVAGSFPSIAFGTSASTVEDFVWHPFSSTQPYAVPRS